MKLRTAIKICRYEFEPEIRWRSRYSYAQIRNAIKRCRRRDIKDKRIPYIPSIEEQKESFDMMGCILIDVMCDDPDEADRRKTELLTLSGEKGVWREEN